MGIFGWSYPPGCNSVPGDEPESPCILCGRDVNSCECDECKECGVCGCVEHLSVNELFSLLNLREFQYIELNNEVKRRQEKESFNCPGCNTKLIPDLYEGLPNWCNTCKKSVDKNGFVVEECY